jgi:anthranilate synthase/aminodeoxychorismate synthase-like glutamine amidotransferase
MILLIDHNDSFVFNLARLIHTLGYETKVISTDQCCHALIESLQPHAIILSPGPDNPLCFPQTQTIFQAYYQSIPFLGICLGHQMIAAYLGATICLAKEPKHGKSAYIHHKNEALFHGLENPLRVGLYHALAVEPTTLPKQLKVIAWTEENEIMSLAHDQLPLYGLQFHPESIMTDCGMQLLSWFCDKAYTCYA